MSAGSPLGTTLRSGFWADSSDMFASAACNYLVRRGLDPVPWRGEFVVQNGAKDARCTRSCGREYDTTSVTIFATASLPSNV
jgi:hypothetical protein